MQQTLRRMNRGTLTVIGVALAVVCFLAVNLFATLQLGAARLDLRRFIRPKTDHATQEFAASCTDPSITPQSHVRSGDRG